MATIYFGELIVSVIEDYEDVCEAVCIAEVNNENYIELKEFHKKFEEGNARFVTVERKIFVRIDRIQYIQE